MKNIFVFSVFLLSNYGYCQNKLSDLYLLYFENTESQISQNKNLIMSRYSYAKDMPFSYVYALNTMGGYIELDTFTENYEGIKKFPTDTITLDSLEMISLKDIRWLQQEYKKHIYMDLNELYRNIYIIEIDSIHKIAYRTKVVQVDRID
ncbi:MAG: hypothetical protein U1C58_00065 [Flavobacteriaceae bacterium]|nr:hypothetical protein [Flavobacteriaceae bacterium]